MRFTTRLTAWLAASLLTLTAFAAAEGDPAAELDAALKRLEGSSYRKREQVFGVMAKAMKGPPMVTEVSGDRTRLVMEMEVPGYGKVKQERIAIGERAAVRMSAPGITAKLEEAKRKMTVSSVKNVLSQLASIAVAMQTGGLSAADLLLKGGSTAMSIKTTAQARSALDQALGSFERWQVVPQDGEEDLPMPMASLSDSGDFMTVEKVSMKDGKSFRYTRRLKAGMPGADAFYSVYFIDAVTGLPVAEETFVQGERMMRAEFFDVGAAIDIELPDCLK